MDRSDSPYYLLSIILIAILVVPACSYFFAQLRLFSIERTLRAILEEMRISRVGAAGVVHAEAGFEVKTNRGPIIWGAVVGVGLIGLAIFILTYH